MFDFLAGYIVLGGWELKRKFRWNPASPVTILYKDSSVAGWRWCADLT